jgi:hypothetical protein
METIPWNAVGAGSGWAIVGVLVVMLFRGLIVTRREHDNVVSDLREQNAALRETNKHLAEQNSVMLGASMPAFNSLLTALRQAAGESP